MLSNVLYFKEIWLCPVLVGFFISSMAYRRDKCKCAIAFQTALAAVMSAMSAASYLNWHYAEICKSALAAVMAPICFPSKSNSNRTSAEKVLPAA